jgi:thiamine-phosphate pyrophosphorylase
MALLPDNRPLLCYITDRQAAAGGEVLPLIERAIAAGVDLIQIRERDLSGRALLALVAAAVARARGTATRILVNDRLDVALAAGAGFHLPTHGFAVADVRRAYPDLLIGASCHNLDELRRAETGGADFVVFGPVFETPSKKPFGPPLGVEKLAEAARAAKIPVLALGGVTLGNAAACLAAGAAGLAAISLFQQAADLKDAVRQLRSLATE